MRQIARRRYACPVCGAGRTLKSAATAVLFSTAILPALVIMVAGNQPRLTGKSPDVTSTMIKQQVIIAGLGYVTTPAGKLISYW